MDNQPTLPGIPAPNPPAPDTAGGVELSDNALKMIKNEVVSLLSHNTDARAALKSIILEALADSGELTTGNLGSTFRNSPDVYQRLADTTFESDQKVEAHESPAVGQAEIAGH